MSVQDLNVLVNLAERARERGLIRFDEFAVVAEAIKNAVVFIQENSTPETTEETPKQKGKTAKIN